MTYALLFGCLAAIAAVVLGYPLIGFLRARRLGKSISAEGPDTHFSKAGTPTMGGVLFIAVAILLGLAAAVPKDADALLPLGIAALMCVVGVYDDLGTLIDREKREAHDRAGMLLKLAAFSAAGIAVALLLYGPLDAPRLLVPHYGKYDIGPIYVLFAIGIFVATTTSVGVTDGLDMLLGSTAAVAFAAFGVIALMQGQEALATVCFLFMGALCGFLWHNAFPARLFMGDAGALPLGAALATVAMQTGWWLLLPVIGAVFVAEGLSDVIQVGYFRLTGGKRVFRMAPLHHHFEKLGWPETRITVRFLMVGIVGALLGCGLAGLD